MGETTTQAVTPLDGDIVEVLRTWPSVWTEVDFDRQSALRDTTVAHLVSAGLLQARHTWIWTFQPPSASTNSDTETEEVEFIIDVCGEGWTEWLQELWPRICPPHWFNGTTAQGHYGGSITAVKLRLSEQGESAKRDIEAGDQFRVVDFVLRRGRYADRLKTNRTVNVLSVTRKPNRVGWPRQSTDAIRGETIGPTLRPEIAPQADQEITPPGVKNEAPRRVPKEPSPEAFAAYRIQVSIGWTQEQIAEQLKQEFKRPFDQGSVSRMLKQVRQFLKAGGELPPLTSVESVDPKVIELGARQDHQTQRQRIHRTTDE